jgi:hypothetical protein
VPSTYVRLTLKARGRRIVAAYHNCVSLLNQVRL